MGPQHIRKVIIMVSKTTKDDAPKVVTPAVVNRDIPADIAGTTYILGGKPYNPRVLHNSYQWEKMVALLDAAGAKGVKGPALAESLTAHHSQPDKTHFNFISYLTRRGSLATK